MTDRQLATCDRFEAEGREIGAAISVTDIASPSGPVVTLFERFRDGGLLRWRVYDDGVAELVDAA